MKKSTRKPIQKAELKAAIKKTFDDMMTDVLVGKVSIQDFTQRLSYDYTQKKMEITGSIF